MDDRQMPDQAGPTAVVTGANSGLGLVTARELPRSGASVVLACRDTDRGARALQRIETSAPPLLDRTVMTITSEQLTGAKFELPG